jgi:hypothetical protein
VVLGLWTASLLVEVAEAVALSLEAVEQVVIYTPLISICQRDQNLLSLAQVAQAVMSLLLLPRLD